MTEDEMVGWHHQLNGHDFEQTQSKGINNHKDKFAHVNWKRNMFFLPLQIRLIYY